MSADFSPAKETLRLVKLQDYGIVDTPSEQAYDDIARLAAYICKAPTALVSFVTADRQWFKAKVGLEVSETPRDMAFCAHTIQQSDVFTVEDTYKSEQFRSNPLVTSNPNIRFYAGAPLITPDGFALGSLCVIDYVPRQISHHQKQALQILSRQVVAQMELSHQSRQLEKANRTLERRVAERTARLTVALQKLLTAQNRLQKRELSLRHSALHDPLTGLPNRSYFMQRLEQAIQLANREPNRLYALLFIDLDNFKPVNDTLGHIVGDHLLKHIASQIKRLLRKSDLVARLGGDEFAVLLDDIPNEEHAIAAVKRVQTQLKQPFTYDGNHISVGASIGITFSTQGYRKPEAALRDADIAMYRAKSRNKRQDRKRLDTQATHQQPRALGALRSPIVIDEAAPIAQSFVVFNPTLSQSSEAHRILDSELPQALLKNQFELYYQPIFKLTRHRSVAQATALTSHKQIRQSTHLAGFEVLLRWNHPQKGLLEAAEFISAAEEIGIVRQICEQTIQTACIHIKKWCDRLQRSDLRIHINLSLPEIQSHKLLPHWQNALSQYHLNPIVCCAEINEQLLLSEDPAITQTLYQLSEIGINLCINDFGRGPSSLSRLHQLSISSLKIDRAFTQNLAKGNNTDIVRTILDLGRSADIGVIAEGIETKHQLSELVSLGCEFGQGFWLAKPTTADEIDQCLETLL